MAGVGLRHSAQRSSSYRRPLTPRPRLLINKTNSYYSNGFTKLWNESEATDMNNSSVEPDLEPDQVTDPSCSSGTSGEASGPPLWVRQVIGKTVLRLCRWKQTRPCPKVNCWAQPFCACARADWAAAKKTEGRVWAIIAACGGLVLIIALARAFLFKA